MTDIRAQLAAAFAGELAEHLAAIRAGLSAVAGGASADLRDMFRRAHSLKGAARAVADPETEAKAHALEAVLAAVEQGERTLDSTAIGEIRGALDEIEDAAGGRTATREADEPAPIDTLRVSGSHVGQLGRSVLALAEEVRARGAVAEALAGIEAELRGVAGLPGGDEARRRIARVLGDVRRLRRSTGEAQANLERALTGLERDAERIMLLPANILFDGFERMVREVAAAQGKQVAFRTDGGEAEADRRVLQELRDPVMHLLRNAIGHGIEAPEARRRAGKPADGAVSVSIQAERGELIVTIADDGRGLDYARIETEARRSGLVTGPATPTREALRAAIFEHRFSTSGDVDEISGRGVGLSVVAEAARRLHGRVSIGEREGGGTRAILIVPLRITRQTLVMFELGGAPFAIPAGAVRRLLRLAPGDIAAAGGGEVTAIDGAAVPVVALAPLIGIAAAAADGHHAALLVADGDAQAAFVVDRLHEVRRAIIGDPTAIPVEIDVVFGTTILDDGQVALVLNPRAIIERIAGHAGGARLAVANAPRAAHRTTILVVDDSVTTRTLERSILEAQGYRVLLSVDGLDGLEQLRSGMDEIALVVADVEMPRMDGFGLLSAIRNDPVLANIPVVMMTSRNSPEDIERGLALGANAYVTKQDFDQGGLISIVGQLI